ncbi:hypothetical protein A5673_22550 [Mycobacterium sp. E3198]|nr:hypothetical protein A5673_22550 [Mycobacterium sp. E3198]
MVAAVAVSITMTVPPPASSPRALDATYTRRPLGLTAIPVTNPSIAAKATATPSARTADIQAPPP